MTTAFAVTWDYRCPFARNAHEHVLAGLRAGAPWDVHYSAFSLNQVHVEEGQPDVWGNPDARPSLRAMEVGIAVRDRWPEAFPRVHLALFAARHDEGLDIREYDVLEKVIVDQGLDPGEVRAEIDSGRPLATFREEHESMVASHRVFGVPTFVTGDEAVFVRFMHRPGEDLESGRTAVDHVLELLTGRVELNEFKRTRIPR